MGQHKGPKKGGPVGSRAEPTGPRRMRRPADALASVGSLPPMTVDKHADPICLSVTRLWRRAGGMTNLVLHVCNRVFDGSARSRLSCGNVVRAYRTRSGGFGGPFSKVDSASPPPRNHRGAAAGPGDGCPPRSDKADSGQRSRRPGWRGSGDHPGTAPGAGQSGVGTPVAKSQLLIQLHIWARS